ncbi:UNKNOWN [Stylonychia lemnae]|uniref:Uncharacterized protein n=1 Tax=Stylonychia lemnae TaxID=5949 RepID=A0A077ZXJ9_STYLE|nr:UNKNOWN [Stylonychia lemnae]|eukprot:CDW73952.1 UNKNOWN [Stylonychia lemnae]
MRCLYQQQLDSEIFKQASSNKMGSQKINIHQLTSQKKDDDSLEKSMGKSLANIKVSKKTVKLKRMDEKNTNSAIKYIAARRKAGDQDIVEDPDSRNEMVERKINKRSLRLIATINERKNNGRKLNSREWNITLRNQHKNSSDSLEIKITEYYSTSNKLISINVDRSNISTKLKDSQPIIGVSQLSNNNQNVNNNNIQLNIPKPQNLNNSFQKLQNSGRSVIKQQRVIKEMIDKKIQSVFDVQLKNGPKITQAVASGCMTKSNNVSNKNIPQFGFQREKRKSMYPELNDQQKQDVENLVGKIKEVPTTQKSILKNPVTKTIEEYFKETTLPHKIRRMTSKVDEKARRKSMGIFLNNANKSFKAPLLPSDQIQVEKVTPHAQTPIAIQKSLKSHISNYTESDSADTFDIRENQMNEQQINEEINKFMESMQQNQNFPYTPMSKNNNQEILISGGSPDMGQSSSFFNQHSSNFLQYQDKLKNLKMMREYSKWQLIQKTKNKEEYYFTRKYMKTKKPNIYSFIQIPFLKERSYNHNTDSMQNEEFQDLSYQLNSQKKKQGLLQQYDLNHKKNYSTGAQQLPSKNSFQQYNNILRPPSSKFSNRYKNDQDIVQLVIEMASKGKPILDEIIQGLNNRELMNKSTAHN